MGCKVLAERIGTNFEDIRGIKIHHPVEITGLLKHLSEGQCLMLDLGKDSTGLAYVQAAVHHIGGRRTGDLGTWPLAALQQSTPADFMAFAKRLGITPAAFRGLIEQKAKEGHIKNG